MRCELALMFEVCLGVTVVKKNVFWRKTCELETGGAVHIALDKKFLLTIFVTSAKDR